MRQLRLERHASRDRKEERTVSKIQRDDRGRAPWPGYSRSEVQRLERAKPQTRAKEHGKRERAHEEAMPLISFNLHGGARQRAALQESDYTDRRVRNDPACV